MNSVYEAKILGLTKIEDPRGNLSIIEQFKQLPFEIKRAYWIYDVPGGKTRSGHAFRTQEEFIVALSGSVLTMPGLPKVPAANNIDVIDGKVVGLF